MATSTLITGTALLPAIPTSYLSDAGVCIGSNLNRAVERFAGGWQTSGIITARTGEAYTAFLSYDPTNTGTGGPWPNRIHDPKDFSL